MTNPVVYYGERGLVNGLVLELHGNHRVIYPRILFN